MDIKVSSACGLLAQSGDILISLSPLQVYASTRFMTILYEKHSLRLFCQVYNNSLRKTLFMTIIHSKLHLKEPLGKLNCPIYRLYIAHTKTIYPVVEMTAVWPTPPTTIYGPTFRGTAIR